MHFCDYKTIANTPNLPLFSPDKRFSFKERIFYYSSKRKALYGLYLRFPLDFFFRYCTLAPIVRLPVRYSYVPKPGNLAADLSRRKLVINGGKARKEKVRAAIVLYWRFFELNPVNPILAAHQSSSCFRLITISLLVEKSQSLMSSSAVG